MRNDMQSPRGRPVTMPTGAREGREERRVWEGMRVSVQFKPGVSSVPW